MTHIYTLPAHKSFLSTLAQALLEGRLIPGFPGQDLFRLSDATVYLPTQRAARGFGQALVAASGLEALLLPRIVPLGAFAGEDEDFEEDFDAPPAVGDLTRRMTLARLIFAWGCSLKGAIRRVGADGRLEVDAQEPPLVAATPAQALQLAGELAALIDDMRIEGVGFEKLAGLCGDAFDPYWRITLDFLKIAFEAWPSWLDERGLVDRAQRIERAVALEIPRLPHRGPTLIAGSTGTNAAIAQLIGAVARAPQGAVVLADLDVSLDEAAWQLIAEAQDPALAAHPQATLARLLRRIPIKREDVVPLGEPNARSLCLTQAMRPAETTHVWAQGPVSAREALADMALVVAENEAEEALVATLALREVLETPQRTAALITPDPYLARRVAAELMRFGIVVENSAGTSLSISEEGRAARLILAAARDFSPLNIAALLALRGIELDMLRTALPFEDLTQASDPLVVELVQTLKPLRDAAGGPLAGLVAAHRDVLATLGDEDETISLLLEEWAQACGEGFACSLADYEAMFSTLLATRAPPVPIGHPRLVILGLLEARLVTYDRLVLSGLDEGIWPPPASHDAFLNGAMRAELGLSSPERRIGQTAQDFIAALGTRDVIMTRARKREGSPTVASRFLRRIQAFTGDEGMSALQARGVPYLAWARALDRAPPQPPAERPAPKPPVKLRPSKLSVTQIETLRRDPYAVYARHILRLRPLPRWAPEVNLGVLGSLWHRVLEDYARCPPFTRARLQTLAETVFAPLLADPRFRTLRWPFIVGILDDVYAFDTQRRAEAERIFVEQWGEWGFSLADGSEFCLSARADRIELGRDGLASIIDYKSGTVPGKAEIQVGFAPQLTLEAAMLKRGAFVKIPSLKTREGIYFKLGKEPTAVRFDNATWDEVAEQHVSGLTALLSAYRREETPYLSRPYPKFVRRNGDYDHLARVAEWMLADSEDE